MNWLNLLLAVLATWRLTHFLHREDGPYNLGNRIRQAAGLFFDEQSQCQATTEVGKALCCFHCTSVWAAGIVTWVQTGKLDIVRIFAVSAAVIVLDEWRHV